MILEILSKTHRNRLKNLAIPFLLIYQSDRYQKSMLRIFKFLFQVVRVLINSWFGTLYGNIII